MTPSEPTTCLDHFATTRLRADRIRLQDLDLLAAMHQDPRVMATLGGLQSFEETTRRHTLHLEHWQNHGCGAWIFRDLATGVFVGRAGLRRIEIDGQEELELHYALQADFWGKGLCTEMARALVRLAFEQLGFLEMASFTLPTNRASQRVMEKTGFSYEKGIIHASLPHVFYRLTLPLWQSLPSRFEPVVVLNADL